jgi:hypothetical protein
LTAPTRRFNLMIDAAPECHRRDADRPPLVARPCSCGAMARLIDQLSIVDCPPADRRAFLFQVNHYD